MASPSDNFQIEHSEQQLSHQDMEDSESRGSSSNADELSQPGEAPDLAVYYTSHSKREVLSTKPFLRKKRTFLLFSHFKIKRMKEISVEVIPNENQGNGEELTFLKVIGSASDELKQSIREQKEFCKVKIMTQVTDKRNGSVLVPHMHHDPVELGDDGEVAYRWPLMISEEVRQWAADKFEITIEVVLETHPALQTAEAEEGYTLVSKLVVT